MSEQEKITMIAFWYVTTFKTIEYSAMPKKNWDDFGSDNPDYNYISQVEIDKPDGVDEIDIPLLSLEREVREAKEKLSEKQGALNEALAKKH